MRDHIKFTILVKLRSKRVNKKKIEISEEIKIREEIEIIEEKEIKIRED